MSKENNEIFSNYRKKLFSQKNQTDKRPDNNEYFCLVHFPMKYFKCNTLRYNIFYCSTPILVLHLYILTQMEQKKINRNEEKNYFSCNFQFF